MRIYWGEVKMDINEYIRRKNKGRTSSPEEVIKK